MLTKKRFLWVMMAFLLSCITVAAQQQEPVKVNIAPDHADWLYKPGEKVKFKVSVTKNDEPLPNVEISYEVGMMPPAKQGKKTLKKGNIVINGGTLKDAGFLRFKVSAIYLDKVYESVATVVFVPETFQPATTLPTDELKIVRIAMEEEEPEPDESECSTTLKAQSIEESRQKLADHATSGTVVAPNAVETLTWNGKTFPIIGYHPISEKDQTILCVPIEYAKHFLPSYCSGVVSRSLIGEITINEGRYAGTHHVYYIFINDGWDVPRFNIYLDTPWID
ncbi:MAG: hypothetical protein LBN37_05820 [Bacteroidales bacterium]|jgi:hypothetical protein|nr:hypothetical protein [Bacteroidales bacterium]